MPSFLDYQEKARSRTKLLVGAYLLCLALFAALFAGIAGAVTALVEGAESAEVLADPDWWVAHADICGATALAVVSVVAIATLVRSSQLGGGGGGAVATALGGRRVAFGATHDPLEKRLLNIVEEMAIASGIAIPEVYVLDNETGINAFAAGKSPNEAAVAVTRGALENLSREQLQCVIGHEFSHILNGDMRLNIRLLASIFGIACLAIFGRILLRAAWEILRSPRIRRSKKDDGDPRIPISAALAISGLAVWILGSLGVLFGRILQSMISRQREFLADASAVQFTRNPAGMAGALKTIGAISRHSSLSSPRSTEVSHMLFASGGGALAMLFATHPPLDARIRRFDPSFSGDYRETYRALERRRAAMNAGHIADDDPDDAEALRAVLAGGVARRAMRSATRARAPATSATATPPPTTDSRVDAAPGATLATLPTQLFAALRDPTEAPFALCGALLEEDASARAGQLSAIAAASGAAALPNVESKAETWRLALRGISLREKIALCEIAASTLRGEPEARRVAIAEALHAAVAADGSVTAFEFAVERLIGNRIVPPPKAARISASAAAPSVATVLHAIAAFGATGGQAENAASAGRTAFAAGVAALPPSFPLRPDAPPPRNLDFGEFSAALDRLRGLDPADKQSVLDACLATVRADGVVTDDESASLGAVADTIGAEGWMPEQDSGFSDSGISNSHNP